MKNIKIFDLKTTDSTNEYAKSLLKTGANIMPFMVTAEGQKSGKGQGDNRWESEDKQNLLCSVALSPQSLTVSQQFIISKIASVSIRQTIEPYVKNVSIKWPNDIYVGYKKIAGILIENSVCGESIMHTVIGIGLNINQVNFPQELPNPTSLSLETGQQFEVKKIRDALLDRLIHNFECINEVSEQYENALLLKNEICRFKDSHQNIFRGEILGINEIGQLKIKDLDHQQTLLFSNQEVSWILPE